MQQVAVELPPLEVMPEFVTALHDFVAEDGEDLPFRAGDRIEVIEKDDLYDDGWWKGRNPQGKVGLFPKVFTVPAPSSTNPLYSNISSIVVSSQPEQSTDISEEDDEESDDEIHDEDHLNQGESSKHEGHTDHEEQHTEDENQPQVDEVDEHPVKGEHPKNEKQLQVEQHTVDEECSTDEEKPDDEEHTHDKDDSDHGRRLEKARRRRGAILDLQTAVEALGPRVAETRVRDGNDDEGSPPDWLGCTFQWEGFREMLENAWRMTYSQDLLTESATTISHMSSGNGTISDTFSKDKTETQNSSSAVSQVSSLDLLATKTAATEKKIFGLPLPASTSANAAVEDNSIIVTTPCLHRTKHSSAIPTDTCVSFGLPSPATTDPNGASRPNTESALSLFSDDAFPSELSSLVPADQRAINQAGASRLNTDSIVSFFSTATSPSEGSSPLHAGQRLAKTGASRSNTDSVASFYSNYASEPSSPLPAGQHSTEKTDSIVHLSLNNGLLTELPSPFPTNQHLIAGNKVKQNLLSDWTLQEVVEWLKSKGFDQDVCNKFIEHEITGDVLLELDINLLKTEMGVMAFGKRTRIVNAITDLRQSHPVISTDQPTAEILPSSSSKCDTPLHFDTQVDEVHQERSSMWSSLPPPSSSEHTPLHFDTQVHEIRQERSSISSSSKSVLWQMRPSSLPMHPTSARASTKVHETRQERFSTSEPSTSVRGEIPSPSLPLRRSPQLSDKVSEIRRERRSPSAPPRSMRRPPPTISQVSSTPSDSLNGETEGARTPFNDSCQATEEGKKTEEMTPEMAIIMRQNDAHKRRIAQASNNSHLVVGKDSVGVGAMQNASVVHRIGEPDHVGWLRKKNDRYNFWKPRFFILKGQRLYWFKSVKLSENIPKGIIEIVGYKVTAVDNTLDSGRYGFRLDRDQERTYFFSSDNENAIRDWTKAIMKATISRRYSKPIVSSCNISTVPMSVARAMDPVPRPPSPTARETIQRSLRRRNTDNLSSRDTRVLLGLSSYMGDDQALSDSFLSEQWQESISLQKRTSSQRSVLRRPSMPEMRRASSTRSTINPAELNALVRWANSHLPTSLQVQDSSASFSGLALLRLAESIKGPCSPPVPDNAFPTDPSDDKVEGLFRLLEFLLNNGVRMGRLSINDIRHGRRDKILTLLKALKIWEGQIIAAYKEQFVVPIRM